ncbi:hypothetical protein TNCV_366361 [Trichonephila clavipes]|nr:hypothetical protein TNCV_366361 [Trichonephila clavipes]
MSLKTLCVKVLTCVKSVEAQIPPVGVVGKLGEWSHSSVIVLVTRPWLKTTRSVVALFRVVKPLLILPYLPEMELHNRWISCNVVISSLLKFLFITKWIPQL